MRTREPSRTAADEGCAEDGLAADDGNGARGSARGLAAACAAAPPAAAAGDTGAV
jgi:hypothetical protein